MVFQSYALYPHLTVYDNMAFALKLRKETKDEIDKKVKNAEDETTDEVTEEDEDEAEDIGLVDDNNIEKATKDELDEDDDLDFSSVPDKSLNSYSTVFDSITSIPLSEQAKFASLIEQGEVSVTCR